MADYEQAYRDLRAVVEALRDRWARSVTWDGKPAMVERGFADALTALLASSAPATASEGATEDWRDVPHVHAGTDCRGGDDCPARPEPCIAPLGNLCTETGCWDMDRCVVYPATPSSSDADRGLSDEELDALLHWLHGGAAGGIQSLWAMVERILAARTAQPDGVERVEWGHRYPDGSLVPDSSEAVAKSRAAISSARGGEPLVLVRRTVTPWEVVGDE